MSYRPTGRAAMDAKMLGTEFGFNCLAALFGAFIVSRVIGGYAIRVLCATCIGLAAWSSISTSYWNWYVFPTEYTIAELLTEGAGWLFVGLGIAAIAKPRAKTPATT